MKTMNNTELANSDFENHRKVVPLSLPFPCPRLSNPRMTTLTLSPIYSTFKLLEDRAVDIYYLLSLLFGVSPSDRKSRAYDFPALLRTLRVPGIHFISSFVNFQRRVLIRQFHQSFDPSSSFVIPPIHPWRGIRSSSLVVVKPIKILLNAQIIALR